MTPEGFAVEDVFEPGPCTKPWCMRVMTTPLAVEASRVAVFNCQGELTSETRIGPGKPTVTMPPAPTPVEPLFWVRTSGSEEPQPEKTSQMRAMPASASVFCVMSCVVIDAAPEIGTSSA